ncbi:MAG: hypothetical protein VB957_12305 [Pseudomonadales bacterium]
MRILTVAVLAFLLPINLLAEDIASNETAIPEPLNKTLVWPDGTRYVGGVEGGKRTGKGTIFWQDGTRFVGMFKDDMRNGPGTMILPDGTVYTGIFKNDELVDSPAGSTIAAAEASPPATQEQAPESVEPKNKSSKPSVKETSTQQVQSTESSKTKVASVEQEFSEEITTLTNEVKNQLIDTIDLWAAAWSEQNVPQYLSNYSSAFKVPGKQSRRSWEGLRRSRLNRPNSISIKIVYEKFEIAEPNVADVSFKQTYRSDVYKEVADKVLRMRKEGQHWKIVLERSF